MSSILLYIKYIILSFRSQMEYKLSFVFMSLGHFLITFIEFIGLFVLFRRFGSVKGWSIFEVSVFYGIINTSFAIAEAFGRGYDIFSEYIRTGNFDRILLRPRAISLQVLGSEFQLMRIGRLFQGILILLWGLNHLNIKIGIFQLALILITILTGVAFFTGLFVLQAAISFWSIQNLELINSFTYGGVMTAQYPITIYKKWFRKIFIYIIPIGCVSYFPLSTLLREGSQITGFIAPFAGILFFIISLQIFRFGIRHYSSTGS